MRLRWLHCWTWTKALAVLAVLMHAGLTVRHTVHATQLAAADLVLMFCHGDGTAPTATRWPQPGDPAGAPKAPCPVCTGAFAGAALLPVQAVLPAPLRVPAALDFAAVSAIVPVRAEVPPPGRGPPHQNA